MGEKLTDQRAIGPVSTTTVKMDFQTERRGQLWTGCHQRSKCLVGCGERQRSTIIAMV